MFCGDDGTRTRDIQLAKLALSQLSYIPGLRHPCWLALRAGKVPLKVRVLGFEPRTSALSELRSSQLSYTP